MILASASPRRRQLLNSAGYDFTVVPPPINEPGSLSLDATGAAAWAEVLAYFKASLVGQLHNEAIIIGADTIVTHSGNIIGKARDESEARRILSTMFGGRNDVITGLAVLAPGMNKRIITHDITTLVMRPMNEQELEDYIASGVWRDKAGAYAFQEGGDKFVQSITGSESNIVGLPMEKLEEVLLLFTK